MAWGYAIASGIDLTLLVGFVAIESEGCQGSIVAPHSVGGSVVL
jgi:hypothetical protein